MEWTLNTTAVVRYNQQHLLMGWSCTSFTQGQMLTAAITEIG